MDSTTLWQEGFSMQLLDDPPMQNGKIGMHRRECPDIGMGIGNTLE